MGRSGWLENNITASLVFHPHSTHPPIHGAKASITRNDSLYRRLYILFLCFHVRRAFRKNIVRRRKAAAVERRIKRKESNNTSIESIVIALRAIFMEV